MGVADVVHRLDDAGSTQQRILAPRHRRRPGMALDALDVDLVPPLPVGERHDPDIVAAFFEDRTLLDVRLQERMHRPAADRRLALVADPRELIAEFLSDPSRVGIVVVTTAEEMPVEDGEVDVIISNCVINLSPDKPRVFRDAFRVLKPGGRLAISDVVASTELPEEVRRDLHLYDNCMAGASQIDELEQMLAEAGFENIRITPKDESREFIRDWAPGRGIEAYVLSATIEAIKPAGAAG